MRSRNRNHRKLLALGAVVILSACNALLDNDSRHLAWDDNLAGAGQHGGGDEHAAGMRSEAGRGEGGALPGNDGGARPDDGGAGVSSGVPGVSGAAGSDAQAGSAPDSCTAPGACTPGLVGMQMEHCGPCMTGTRAQARTCDSSCAWGAWGAWGECTGVTATCTPGNSESRSVGCPCSGSKSQKRTCSSSCAWEGWTDTSSCDLECCSEIVYCNTPDDISPASRGTWCRRTDPDCANEQVDSDCLADVEKICGAVVPELYVQH